MAEAELREQLQRLEASNAELNLRLGTAYIAANESVLPPTQVFKVSVKLPPFWPDRPAVWFAQAEANFEIAGITIDSTKYNYVVGGLNERVAMEIEDIISAPPKENRYIYLKAELIRRLSVSQEKRLSQLLGDEELAGRKPSQFLRHLRTLAGSNLKDESILRQ